MEKARQHSALALALLLLAGCTSAGPEEPALAGPGNATFDWIMLDTEEGVRLMYGLPDSDVVDFILSCEETGPEIMIPSFTRDVQLASGGVRRTYRLDAVRDEEGDYSTRKIARNDAVLGAFVRTGELRILGHAAWLDWSATTEAERAGLRRFATACGVRG